MGSKTQSTRIKFRIIEAESFLNAKFTERVIIAKRPGHWQIHLVLADGTKEGFASFSDNEFTLRLVTETALRARELRGVKVAGLTLDMTEEDRNRLLNWNNSITLNNAPFDWDVDHIDELKEEVA
jgi:hypothetical protein